MCHLLPGDIVHRARACASSGDVLVCIGSHVPVSRHVRSLHDLRSTRMQDPVPKAECSPSTVPCLVALLARAPLLQQLRVLRACHAHSWHSTDQKSTQRVGVSSIQWHHNFCNVNLQIQVFITQLRQQQAVIYAGPRHVCRALAGL
jgi:hypothetical protein